ncbi:MAG: MotA/TolQ/ExbB proton channel family protein [Verrucomicrobiia bacterium]
MSKTIHGFKGAILCAAVLGVTIAVCGAAEPQKTEPPPEGKKRETIWTLIVKGGPVMIPLGLCSIIALASAIERFVSLKRSKIIPPNFIEGLKQKLEKSNPGAAPDIEEAVKFCEETQTPVGNIFKAGLMNLHRGEDAIEKAIEDAGAREIDKMKRSLRILAVIVTVSPLLGLLGTVYGMIGAFEVSTQVGVGKAEFLAKGIYEALVTTAAGLTIAIPAFFVYQFLNSKIDGLIDEIDDMGIEFMEYYLKKINKTNNTRL